MKTKKQTVIREYLQALNKVLVCKRTVKKAVLDEIKVQIGEVEQRVPVLTQEILYKEIGLPEEVARGFESREDIDVIRAKAKKYERNRITCCLVAFAAAVVILFATVLIISQDDYYSDTHVNSSIGEITS